MERHVVRYERERRAVNIFTTFQDKIRLFEKESRQHQTFYYHFTPCLEYTLQSNFTNLKNLKSVLKQIVASVFVGQPTSQMHKKADELLECILWKYIVTKKLSIAVVWVYFYQFENQEMQSYPVFRIKRNDNDYQFIDWIQKEHSSWEEFLDNYELPLGLICVPENGIYKWSNEFKHLSLEFFSTRAASAENLKRNNIRNNSTIFTHFQPQISKIFVWLHEIEDYLITLESSVRTRFWNLWEKIKLLGRPAMILCVRIIFLVPKYIKNGTFNKLALNELPNDILGLFRCIERPELSDETALVNEFFDNLPKIDEAWKEAKQKNGMSEWKNLCVSILQAVAPFLKFVENLLPALIPNSYALFLSIAIIKLISFFTREAPSSNEKRNNGTDGVKAISSHEVPHEANNVAEQLYNDILRDRKINEAVIKQITQIPLETEKPTEFIIFESNEHSYVMNKIRRIIGTNFTLDAHKKYSSVIDMFKRDRGVVVCSGSAVYGILFD